MVRNPVHTGRPAMMVGGNDPYRILLRATKSLSVTVSANRFDRREGVSTVHGGAGRTTTTIPEVMLGHDGCRGDTTVCDPVVRRKERRRRIIVYKFASLQLVGVCDHMGRLWGLV